MIPRDCQEWARYPDGAWQLANERATHRDGYRANWLHSGLSKEWTDYRAEWLNSQRTDYRAEWLHSWLTTELSGYTVDWLQSWVATQPADWLQSWVATQRTDYRAEWLHSGLTTERSSYTGSGLSTELSGCVASGLTTELSGYRADWIQSGYSRVVRVARVLWLHGNHNGYARTHTRVSGKWGLMKVFFFFFLRERFSPRRRQITDRGKGSMTVRNRELVSGCWSLAVLPRETALTTGPHTVGWQSGTQLSMIIRLEDVSTETTLENVLLLLLCSVLHICPVKC